MDEASMSPREKALAEEGFRTGLLTEGTVRECLRIRDEMRKLGTEADLGSVLVQKRHITSEGLRALTVSGPAANCFRHPDRPPVSWCARCGRPLCADCVIRVGGTTLCGESCAGPEAKSRERGAAVGPAAGGRWKVGVTLACVAGAGVALTAFLWLLSRHLIAKADHQAFRDLVSRREYGKSLGEEIRLLEEIVARQARFAEVHVYLAREYRRAGEAEKGVRLLAASLERRPGDAEVVLELARCHLALHEFGAARRDLENLLQQRPGHAEAVRELAVLMAEHFPDETEKVEKAIHASLALQPEDKLLRFHLAKCLRRRGLKEQAAKEIAAVFAPPKPGLGELTKRETRFVSGNMAAEIWLLAAELKIEEGKPAAAAPLLEHSLKQHGLNAAAGTLLVKVYLEAGKAAEAGKLLSRLAARLPTDARVWEAMAELDLSRGDLGAYARDLERLYALRSDDLDLATKLVGALIDTGDIKGAALLLKELKSSGDRRIVEFRARLALEGGKLEEARGILEGLSAEGRREPSVVVMLARIERASGNIDEAAELLSELVRAGRGGPGLLATARIHLGLALWQKGDAKAAASEFENAAVQAPTERIKGTVEKLLKLARGQAPDEAAVNHLSTVVRRCAEPKEALVGMEDLAELARAKRRLFAVAFGQGLKQDAGARGDAGYVSQASEGTSETDAPLLKGHKEETVRAELASARVLVLKLDMQVPDALLEAEKVASANGASTEAICSALDAQLAIMCALLEREKMGPASEFLRRKAEVLAAVQEAPESRAVATAYVLAETLASMFSAGELAWAYEPAAWNVVRSLYAADELCSDALVQLCNAERAHVLLLNMLALRKLDAGLLKGP